MRKIRVLVLVSIALIALLIGLKLWQGTNKNEGRIKENPVSIPMENIDMRLEKIHLVEEKQGQKTWELEAKQINQYQGENLLILKDIKVNFYLKDGRVFNLSGREGKYYQDSKNMELLGDIILNSSDGYSLKTNSVFYDHSKKKVSSADIVEIEAGKIQMVGHGMLIDLDAKVFKLLNRVRAKWRGEKG